MFISMLEIDTGTNPDRPNPGRQWLKDIYRVHQRLWMAFPDAQSREQDPFFLSPFKGAGTSTSKPKRSITGFLFRIERDGRPRILVQSAERPDWAYAFQNAAFLLREQKMPMVREFDPQPLINETYKFRLLANVVNRTSVPHPSEQLRTTKSGLSIRRRRRVENIVRLAAVAEPLPTDPLALENAIEQRWKPWREWLEKMGSTHGYHVMDEPNRRLVIQAEHVFLRKPQNSQGVSIEKRFNAGLFEGTLVCSDPAKLRDVLVTGIGSGKAFGFGLLSLARV